MFDFISEDFDSSKIKIYPLKSGENASSAISFKVAQDRRKPGLISVVFKTGEVNGAN